jgi:hypothetical protein
MDVTFPEYRDAEASAEDVPITETSDWLAEAE